MPTAATHDRFANRTRRDQPLIEDSRPRLINDFEAVVMLAMLSDRTERLGVELIESHGYRLAIPNYMPELIQELAARSETWWCTTWRERANDEIVSHLGVGPFPVVDDGADAPGVEWKVEAARPLIEAAVADGRAVVWIEDFNGDLPDLVGVTYVDTGERGVLGWSDVPVDAFE